jgi:hypothetical protein
VRASEREELNLGLRPGGADDLPLIYARGAAGILAAATEPRRALSLGPLHQRPDRRERLQVNVFYDPENQNEGVVYIVTADPLADSAGPWPLLETERTSIWDPIPVGVNENGEDATLTLPESSVLIGGITGAGKSNLVSMIVAAGALDPDCKLWLIDGKQVEFGPWRASAQHVTQDARLWGPSCQGIPGQ